METTTEVREAPSNFEPWAFVFRGLPVGGMEGLVQSVKFKDAEEQKAVMLLSGKAAKFKGKKKKWWRDQLLFWQGVEMKRDSQEFQAFLDEAFEALFTQNEVAREALLATGTARLVHAEGKHDPRRTVLTEQEFVERLMKIRARLTRSVPDAQARPELRCS